MPFQLSIAFLLFLPLPSVNSTKTVPPYVVIDEEFSQTPNIVPRDEIDALLGELDSPPAAVRSVGKNLM